MLEGFSYLAASALGITLLTALAAGAVGLLAGWVLWRRPCEICEEQLLRARAQLEDLDTLEKANQTLRQQVTDLTVRIEAAEHPSPPGEPWDPAAADEPRTEPS